MKFQRYIEKNWLFILTGVWLEAKAIDIAYAFRGYKALGSEYLVLPVFLLIIAGIRKLH